MREMNQKVLGAFVVGVGLVTASYTYVNFGKPKSAYPVYNQEAAPIRSAIAVKDADNNGIEDWRDAFTVTEPIVIGEPAASYTPPTTVTGRLGINLFEDYVRAKNYGPFGKTEEQVVTDTVNRLARDTEQVIYQMRDIETIDAWTNADIKNYANVMGASIIQNSNSDLASELEILGEILTNKKFERTNELSIIAGFYKTMRDQAMATPVPSIFTKEHLDLINVYEALYQDITAMQYSLDDPAVTLLRVRRYQDDALGLELALANMYAALEPHARLFTSNDPAVIFGAFNPNNVTQ
jgi:hypothetical protein